MGLCVECKHHMPLYEAPTQRPDMHVWCRKWRSDVDGGPLEATFARYNLCKGEHWESGTARALIPKALTPKFLMPTTNSGFWKWLKNEIWRMRDPDWEQRCGALYQVIGAMAYYCGKFDHPDTEAALDVASGRGDPENLLPWPKDVVGFQKHIDEKE